MSDPDALIRLPFAANWGAVHLPGGAIANLRQAIPELRRNPSIVRVSHGFGNFAEADRIRNDLQAQGITLIDKAGGLTLWHRG